MIAVGQVIGTVQVAPPQRAYNVQHDAQRRQFPREERTRPVSHHLRYGGGPFGNTTDKRPARPRW